LGTGQTGAGPMRGATPNLFGDSFSSLETGPANHWGQGASLPGGGVKIVADYGAGGGRPLQRAFARAMKAAFCCWLVFFFFFVFFCFGCVFFFFFFFRDVRTGSFIHTDFPPGPPTYVHQEGTLEYAEDLVVG